MKTTEEMIEVMQAHLRGEAIEIIDMCDETTFWLRLPEHFHDWDFVGYDYRIAHKPKPTKDTVPWDAIDERFRWAARDANSTIAAFECAPKPDRDYWSVSAGNFVILTGNFVGTTPGTIDWRESLQQRPEERG